MEIDFYFLCVTAVTSGYYVIQYLKCLKIIEKECFFLDRLQSFCH